MSMRSGGHGGNHGSHFGHQFYGGNSGSWGMPGNESANQEYYNGYGTHNYPSERNHFAQSQNNNFQSELSQSTWNDMRSIYQNSMSPTEHPPLPGRPPEGYMPLHGQIPRQVVDFANHFLSQPFGAEAAFEVNGRHYMARVEPHYHPPGFQGGPNGWHKGVTVYEAISDSNQPPLAVPPGSPEYPQGFNPGYTTGFPQAYPSQGFNPGYTHGFPQAYPPQGFPPGYTPGNAFRHGHSGWHHQRHHYGENHFTVSGNNEYPYAGPYGTAYGNSYDSPGTAYGSPYGSAYGNPVNNRYGCEPLSYYGNSQNTPYEYESLPYYGNPYTQEPIASIVTPPSPPYGSGFQPVNFHPEQQSPLYLQSNNTESTSIVSAANADVGESMWACSPFAASTENGVLGCAASVSEVLQQAGYNYANSAGVTELADQLAAHGWQRIDVANHPELVRPGDVLYGVGVKPGGSAHIGIVGAGMNGQVDEYDNNSADGKWTHTTLDRSALNVVNNSRFENQMWVMRPPQGSPAPG